MPSNEGAHTWKMQHVHVNKDTILTIWPGATYTDRHKRQMNLPDNGWRQLPPAQVRLGNNEHTVGKLFQNSWSLRKVECKNCESNSSVRRLPHAQRLNVILSQWWCSNIMPVSSSSCYKYTYFVQRCSRSHVANPCLVISHNTCE